MKQSCRAIVQHDEIFSVADTGGDLAERRGATVGEVGADLGGVGGAAHAGARLESGAGLPQPLADAAVRQLSLHLPDPGHGLRYLDRKSVV